jgi:prepilin-type N-terminal cleavage/methylation domain-containing protein
MKTKMNNIGFTLIELLVVLALMGILGMIAVPRLIGMTSSSKDKADQASLQLLDNAAKMYRLDSPTKDWPYNDGYSFQSIDTSDPKLGKYLASSIEINNTDNYFIFSGGSFNVGDTAPEVTTPPPTETTAPPEPTEPSITFTVVFKDWNDTVLKTQEVISGGGATPPGNPSRTGWNFIGWSPIDYNIVVSDMIITAQYEEILLTDLQILNLRIADITSGSLSYNSSNSTISIPSELSDGVVFLFTNVTTNNNAIITISTDKKSAAITKRPNGGTRTLTLTLQASKGAETANILFDVLIPSSGAPTITKK